jgi:tetraacyldisaccharide 4'-kinase
MTSSWLERQWWAPKPTAGAQLLRPLAWAYGSLAGLDRRRAVVQLLPVPVVVVGNMVVGGAGKTPTTIALVQALRKLGWTPGVVSRGYGRKDRALRFVDVDMHAEQVGDEPLLIARRTKAPVMVGLDRVQAARSLLEARPEVDLILADDGLQHHALARDAQIIVIDERGFGNGLLLPAGPLREAPGAEPPARSLVLYNAARASTAWPGTLVERKLGGVLLLPAWHLGDSPQMDALIELRKHADIVAAAGIAVPERFFNMLKAWDLSFEARPLPDHHPWAEPLSLKQGQILLVTEKDAVKIPPDSPLAMRTWVAPLDFVLPPSLIDSLQAWLPPRRGAASTTP